MIKLIAIALLSLQQPAQQFDLVCTNTDTGGTYRLRMDLESNRWCEGECREARPIASVDADRYTLFDFDNRGRTLRTQGLSFINRHTGEHYESMISTGGLAQVSRRSGQCERAPFSGMPQPRL